MALSSIQIKMLRRLLHSGTEESIAHAIEKIHPSDLTILFSEVDPHETQRLVNSLVLTAKAGETLSELPEFMLPDILDSIEDKKLGTIVSRLEPDDALFLLEKVPESRWALVLNYLPPDQRNRLNKLLLYPKYSAGSVMTSNYIAVNAKMTTQEAIDNLRQKPEAKGIFYIYVVDDTNHLVGVQSLRGLVVSPPHTKIKDVMYQEVQSVLATTTQEEAAQIVAQYNLLAVPVVSDTKELLGVITVDDVIDIVKEEATEDIYHLAGLSEVDRTTTPVALKVKKRLPWMMLNLLTASISMVVISFFGKSIEQVVALAAFMGIIAALGGNGGMQSLTVITRSIALGELKFIKGYKVILKELTTGFLIGLFCGIVMGVVTYFLKGNIYFGLVLFFAMSVNLLIGGLMGALVPIVFKSLKLDPAIGTSVIVTMFTDAVGYLVFLGIATLMLSRLV